MMSTQHCYALFICLLALVTSGCGGTARRLAGDLQLLPDDGPVGIRIGGVAVEQGQVTLSFNPDEDFRADPAQLTYLWNFNWDPATNQPSTSPPLVSPAQSPAVSPTVTLISSGLVHGNLDVSGFHQGEPIAGHYTFDFTIAPKGWTDWGVTSISAPQEIVTGVAATFTANLGGQAPPQVKYEWSVRDANGALMTTAANPATSIEQNPAITFSNPGAEPLPAFLHVTVSDSHDSSVRRTFILPIQILPKQWDIAFIVAPDRVPSGGTGAISVALSGNAPTTPGYIWQFGDGANPSFGVTNPQSVTFTNTSTTTPLICKIRVRVFDTTNPNDARPSAETYAEHNVVIEPSRPSG